MENIKKTLFYLPTTVLFVDDDPAFLSNIGFEIDNKIPLRSCDKPRNALKILENKPPIQNLINELIAHWNHEDTDIPANWVMKTDIGHLYKKVYDQNRFSHITTLVVDYSMPGLNGAELCKLLRDDPIKKIMLTGAADYNIAVQLFNSGLIDFFIVKDTPQMMDQLNFTIRKAQLDYFEDITSPLMHSVPKTLSCIHEPAFWQNLTNFVYEKKFSEFYLIDESGSFLFLDFFGNPTWMIVKSEKEFESYYNIAIDNEAPADVIQALEKKDKLLFFLTELDQKAPVSRWNRYLNNAVPFPRLEGFYYSIITDNKSCCLDQHLIYSHKDFIDKKCEFVATK